MKNINKLKGGEKEKIFIDSSINDDIKNEVEMNFFSILSDGRTRPLTKMINLVVLMFDLIFLLLLGFGILFLFLNSKMAGYVLIFLALVRYLTKNE